MNLSLSPVTTEKGTPYTHYYRPYPTFLENFFNYNFFFKNHPGNPLLIVLSLQQGFIANNGPSRPIHLWDSTFPPNQKITQDNALVVDCFDTTIPHSFSAGLTMWGPGTILFVGEGAYRVRER